MRDTILFTATTTTNNKSWCLFQIYYIQVLFYNEFHTLSHIISTTTLHGKYYYHSHFTDDETKVHSSEITCHISST
jgi:hypothetical protein